MGELLGREQIALGAEAVGAAAVADVAAHGASPLGVVERLLYVLAHAHLEAVAAPHAAAASAGGCAAPLAARAPRLDVGGLLAAEVAGGALGAPGRVDVLAPRLARAVVATPRSAPAVQAMVVLEGVVLRVLALRGAELGELGAHAAGVHALHATGSRVGRGRVAAQHRALVVVRRASGRGRGRRSARSRRGSAARSRTRRRSAASSASETSSSSEMSDSDVSPMYGRRIAATAGASSS